VDVNGGGYQRTGWESLNELIVGDLPVLHTIDTDVEVTLEQLQQHGGRGRRRLPRDQRARPRFRDSPMAASGDHPDHRSVGRIVAAQVDAGLIDPNIVQYAMGYPTAQPRANIDRDPLARKLKVFAIYAAHDPVIACRTPRLPQGEPFRGLAAAAVSDPPQRDGAGHRLTFTCY
jgi:hypothetical protein